MDTTIKIDSETRDRLAALAQARGTSMRALIEEFAATALTPQELKERAERTRAFLQAEFGHRLEDHEADTLRTKMREAQAAYRKNLKNAGPDVAA
ncbi:ribbon-helix-helix protein, CopG family [Streptomyces sp. NPDC051597]|uniref:ribbon-helix-helix protein, CopG family n=1 Tax=Streptomyces sp. NPDC051597 TaxID=3155049 RepID=UPI00343FDC7E